jgi:hypothetical protein
MQRVPEALAGDVAPELAELLRLGSEQLRHVANAGAMQLPQHADADARYVFERNAEEGAGHVCGCQISMAASTRLRQALTKHGFARCR